MSHHLAVFGGTGFLGRHICRAAVQKGWTVTSISRRGVPNSDQHDGNIQGWTQQVNWCKGDLNDPISLENHVKSASAVIYSVGTLLENRYKSFLSGRDSLFSLFQLSQDENSSYDKLNRDFGNY